MTLTRKKVAWLGLVLNSIFPGIGTIVSRNFLVGILQTILYIISLSTIFVYVGALGSTQNPYLIKAIIFLFLVPLLAIKIWAMFSSRSAVIKSLGDSNFVGLFVNFFTLPGLGSIMSGKNILGFAQAGMHLLLFIGYVMLFGNAKAMGILFGLIFLVRAWAIFSSMLIVDKLTHKNKILLGSMGLFTNMFIYPGIGTILFQRYSTGVFQILMYTSIMISSVLFTDPLTQPYSMLPAVGVWVWTFVDSILYIVSLRPSKQKS